MLPTNAKLRYLERRARGESVRPPRGEKAIAPVSAVAILQVIECLNTMDAHGHLLAHKWREAYMDASLAQMERDGWLICEPNARRIRGKR